MLASDQSEKEGNTMLLSDHIARLIEQMLEEGGGRAEVRRNDLAAQLGCVPSQINYVITSRFNSEHGYVTESKRGGGGYIRIVRVQMGRDEYLMHFFQAVGRAVTETEVRAYLRNLMEHGLLTEREARLAPGMMTTLDVCPVEKRDELRADMLRRLLMMLMMQ